MNRRILSTTLACSSLVMALPMAFAQDNPAPAQPETPVPAVPTPPAPDPSKPLAEQIDMNKISYLIGRSYGDGLKRQYVDVDFDELVRGLKTALAGTDSEVTEEQANELMTAFRPIHSAHVSRQRQLSAFSVDEQGWQELAAKNKATGEAYLAENGKKDGVKTTASGLQYEILTAGTGEIPKATDKVNAIYKGTLIDGTTFDDSEGQPRPFGVTRVVKGWQEALQMMPVGSKWRLTLPSDLAYGPEGNRPPIGPNATLIFEMELASITKPVQAVTPPVGIDIPPRTGTGASTTPAQPRKRITATTPPVTVPIPKKEDPQPAEAPKP